MIRFENILGQEHARAVLMQAISSQRVHHALIFHGPEGVGKFTTAWAFAGLLLCQQPQTQLDGQAVMCGQCRSCRALLAPVAERLLSMERVKAGRNQAGSRGAKSGGKAAGNKKSKAALASEPNQPAPETEKVEHEINTQALASAHPDLHIVTKELALFSEDRDTRERKLMSLPVEVLRERLLEPVYRSAVYAQRKVFIVDEAELLQFSSQNLLLKTLEEPPAGTHIILVTSKEERLLPTIRSRCQRVLFAPLSDQVVTHWLDQQSVNLTASEKQWLIHFVQGSLGRASLVLRYQLVTWAGSVIRELDEMERQRGGAHLGQTMYEMIDNFAKTWVKHHDHASKEAANRQGSELMFTLLTQQARRKLATFAEDTSLEPLAMERHLRPWLELIAAVQEAESMLHNNAHLSLLCDHLASRIALGFGV